MSEIGDIIHEKCLAFGDRVIKLNDYLLSNAAALHKNSIPVHLQAVATLANQLLRSGTSIGANNAEATSAISKADFKSKSYIALKKARESLYWLDLLYRNHYLTDIQHHSLYSDCEELVKLLTHRCKKLDGRFNNE